MLFPQPVKCDIGKGKIKVPSTITVGGAAQKSVEMVFKRKALMGDSDSFIRCSYDSSVKGGFEGYAMDINPKGFISIRSSSDTGITHALRTVSQLLKSFPKELPILKIEDWPAFPERGVMLDISRDRVPTMNTLFQLVDKIAELKGNHLELYIEHTFAYKGHETVWRDASPITSEEMIMLDRYCSERGVSLCANQNVLGHFERWLKHPQYAALGEMDRGHFYSMYWYIEPNTLCATDMKARKFVKELLAELMPLCSGDYVNIGCDEPWDLGKGRSKAEVEKRGRNAVYGEHVADVAEFVVKNGKRPSFWVDPDFGNKRSEIPPLPPELIGNVWGYDGNTDFKNRLKSLGEAGLDAWVYPGANGWNSFTSRTNNRRKNLELAATEGSANSAKGFVITEWGDCGHNQQWPVSLFGMMDGVAVAWSGKSYTDPEAEANHVFNEPALGKWLYKLGEADDCVVTGNSNCTFDVFRKPFLNPSFPGKLEDWEKCCANFKALLKNIPAKDPLIARECRFAAELALWNAERAFLNKKTGASTPHDILHKLTLRLLDLMAEHKDLWMERSRPGGLSDSCNQTYMQRIRMQYD
ncbi:MAG TPA: hypothetical protein DET40_21960 [Lentisphaeria bacterium]|nr:MAG: hypothetical protein A2X45_04055 [Lentisphaerae bacterium GWF2_50_93]HCE46219.1 hypothetical protein [Lentisphaeria bacterium]